MFFRSQRKLQGEVSLSDTLESDGEEGALSLMDVIRVEDTMLDDLETRESHIRVRQLVDECLTEREADIIRQRYGLNGRPPRTQRELAADYGISRSYVSRRAYGKRRLWGNGRLCRALCRPEAAGGALIRCRIPPTGARADQAEKYGPAGKDKTVEIRRVMLYNGREYGHIRNRSGERIQFPARKSLRDRMASWLKTAAAR